MKIKPLTFFLGIIVAMVSLWGGSYLLVEYEDTWMEFPAFVSTSLGFFGGIIFLLWKVLNDEQD